MQWTLSIGQPCQCPHSSLIDTIPCYLFDAARLPILFMLCKQELGHVCRMPDRMYHFIQTNGNVLMYLFVWRVDNTVGQCPKCMHPLIAWCKSCLKVNSPPKNCQAIQANAVYCVCDTSCRCPEWERERAVWPKIARRPSSSVSRAASSGANSGHSLETDKHSPAGVVEILWSNLLLLLPLCWF